MSVEAEEVARRVGELIDRLSRLTREMQFAGGLNPAQWEALRFISRANRYSRTPSAVAEFLGTTKGTASQTLISLENKGLIQRQRSCIDRRSMEIELTDKGFETLRRDPVLQIEEIVRAKEADFGNSVVQSLSRLLLEIQENLGVRKFGGCKACSRFQCGTTAVKPTEAQYCGLTGECLSETDIHRICINFSGDLPTGS